MFQGSGIRGQGSGVRDQGEPTSLACPDAKPETRNSKRRYAAGFTLLEIMIAIAILAVAFTVAMELLATGVRSAKASEEYTQAVLLARQKMAEVAMAPTLEASAGEGDFGQGFHWYSEVQPVPQEEDLPAQMYQVRVRVTWSGRRGEKSLDLYTQRVAVDEKKLGQTRAVQPQGGGGQR